MKFHNKNGVLDGFYSAINLHYQMDNLWTDLLIMADYIEEKMGNEVAAECVRLLAINKKMPHKSFAFSKVINHYYFNANYLAPEDIELVTITNASQLPKLLVNNTSKLDGRSFQKSCKNPALSYEDIINNYCNLTEKQREKVRPLITTRWLTDNDLYPGRKKK